jgi:hypothetical protein
MSLKRQIRFPSRHSPTAQVRSFLSFCFCFLFSFFFMYFSFPHHLTTFLFFYCLCLNFLYRISFFIFSSIFFFSFSLFLLYFSFPLFVSIFMTFKFPSSFLFLSFLYYCLYTVDVGVCIEVFFNLHTYSSALNICFQMIFVFT